MKVKGFDAMVRDVAAETARIEAVKRSGHVPDVCGDAIPQAPARGPVRVFEARAMYPDGADGYESQPAGYRGRKTLQLADAFDVMEAQARRRLFTKGQKLVGRHYRDLVERHGAAGVKCSSIEALGGGSGGGDFMDAVLQDREAIDVFRRRIGGQVSLQVRKVRPSVRGARTAIADRRLVDAVCIEGLTVSDVLRAHGWSVCGETRSAVRSALADVLDRMMGNRPFGRVRSAHYGA
ncbi:hypothetical protein Q4578_16775 [Shimia thalassica]|uniref:hypothetical protein n=1 Tax=Shimia thalassica TaxID=1715693 RepID=UPI001C08FE2D|nr:hypothetical protein [Shimia thalassica]MBU2941400.1 hypothetical protein [Shimia thalassica]MDO6485823.1 hypothetical protein [Shimia thalassica]MDO6505016.1 hypothetical protein [Shimia thalassica]MDO6523253.1 hypothetical protein [Shimia thalassica]